MGCCPSHPRNICRDEFQLVSLQQFKDSGISYNGDVHKAILNIYHAQKNAKSFYRDQSNGNAWEFYLRNMSYATNIMDSALNSDSFAHYNTGTAFRRLGYHDETMQLHFRKHIQLCHQLVENCLQNLKNYDLLDQAVTFFCLGRYHVEKGVEIEEVQTFATSALDVIKKMHKSHGLVLQSSDAKFLGNVFKFISECMVLGMRKQIFAMQYLQLLVDKRGNCMGRKRLERKVITKRAKVSWKRIAKQILSK